MTDFRWSVKLSEEKSTPPLKWTSEMCSPYLFLLLPFLWPSRSLCLTDSFRGSNLRVSPWDKYQVGQKVHWVFFCKIKDTVFILTNNFIDFSILSISAISRMAECWLFSINVCLIAINLNQSTQLWSIIEWEISSTKLCKPHLTLLIHHSTFPTGCTNLFCISVLHFCISESFYLSWNNKA